MDKVCRGTACIINVLNVRGTGPRTGTDVDRDRLSQLFQQLLFDVKVFNDKDGLSANVRKASVSKALRVIYTRYML